MKDMKEMKKKKGKGKRIKLKYLFKTRVIFYYPLRLFRVLYSGTR